MSRLPTTTINGKEYFIDMRLREYRAVDNPHDSIPLGDFAEDEALFDDDDDDDEGFVLRMKGAPRG